MHYNLLVPLLVAVSGAAQAVVVPPTRAMSDATGGGGIAGLSQRFRMQVLIESTALTSLVQRDLTAIALRRDGQYLTAMTGGLTDVVVRLSTAPGAIKDASPVFATNHGVDVREVFRGRVTVPPAPALSHRDGATWSTPHAIEVPFTLPFRYAGGTLCIDVEGSPVTGASSPWWRVDFELFTHDAHAVSVGSGCDPRSSAHASRATLLPGGSVDLLASGPRGAAGVLVLGTNVLSPGINLAFLGAPGCTVRVLPGLTLSGVFVAGRPPEYGDIDMNVQLPASNALLGGTLAVQWIVFPNPINAGRLSTTNALELHLASLPPSLPGVLVRSGPLSATQPMPTTGRVFPQLMPVVRLSYQ